MLNRLRRGVVGQRALRRAGTLALTAVKATRQLQRQQAEHELLQLARLSFLQLQAAWDRADLPALALLATEPLLQDLRHQLDNRGPGPNCTEVLALEARLLALEELREAFVASVEFSGLIRERLGQHAAPFRELWLLANIKSAGRGWQLARVQSLS